MKPTNKSGTAFQKPKHVLKQFVNGTKKQFHIFFSPFKFHAVALHDDTF